MDSQRPDLSGVQLAEQLTDWFWQPVPISVSEIGSGQSNFYEYCLNDPVNYVDLNGLQKLIPTSELTYGLNSMLSFANDHSTDGETGGIFWVDRKEYNDNDGDISKCTVHFWESNKWHPMDRTKQMDATFPMKRYIIGFEAYYPDRKAVGVAHTHPPQGYAMRPSYPGDYHKDILDLYYGNVLVNKEGMFQVVKGMGKGDYYELK